MEGSRREAASTVGEHEYRDDAELVLYGVVGFHRGPGGHGAIGRAGQGSTRRMVRLSESLTFTDGHGGSIVVTSHRPCGDKEFGSVRDSVVTTLYRATRQADYQAWDRVNPIPRPVNVDWAPISILVDGQETVASQIWCKSRLT